MSEDHPGVATADQGDPAVPPDYVRAAKQDGPVIQAEYLRISTLAASHGVPVSTCYTWMERGHELPGGGRSAPLPFLRLGRKRFVRRADLNAFMEAVAEAWAEAS